jgi:hypothetical protein
MALSKEGRIECIKIAELAWQFVRRDLKILENMREGDVKDKLTDTMLQNVATIKQIAKLTGMTALELVEEIEKLEDEF